jgi:hypothetical protein
VGVAPRSSPEPNDRVVQPGEHRLRVMPREVGHFVDDLRLFGGELIVAD